MTTEDLIKNLEAAGFNVEYDRDWTYVDNVYTQEKYDKLESIVREALGADFKEIEAYLMCKRTHPWYWFRTSWEGTGYTPFEFEMLDDMIDLLRCYDYGTAAEFIDEIEEILRDDDYSDEDAPEYIKDEKSRYQTVIEWLKTEDPDEVFAVRNGDIQYKDQYIEASDIFIDDGERYFIGYIIPEVEEYDDEGEDE